MVAFRRASPGLALLSLTVYYEVLPVLQGRDINANEQTLSPQANAKTHAYKPSSNSPHIIQNQAKLFHQIKYCILRDMIPVLPEWHGVR